MAPLFVWTNARVLERNMTLHKRAVNPEGRFMLVFDYRKYRNSNSNGRRWAGVDEKITFHWLRLMKEGLSDVPS